MPETCKSCGAQLFTGARFCRTCGAQLAPLISEDLPTQVMPGTPSGETSQVGTQTQNIFTPPPPGSQYYQQQVPAYQYPVPKSRSPWGWIITFLAIGVFGLVILVALFAARSRSTGPRRPVPPSDTTITVTPAAPAVKKAFELGSDASIIINGGIGDVTLEGWDQSQAEITSDRGGDERSLRGLKIDYSQDGEVLALSADGPGPFGGMPMNIKVKVPRELEHIRVHLKTGNISLSDMTSAIDVVLDHGDVELRNISGSVTTKVGNGNTRVRFKEFSQEAPLSFTTGKGNINLKFESDLDADLEAETGVG